MRHLLPQVFAWAHHVGYFRHVCHRPVRMGVPLSCHAGKCVW